jgi:outer membrane immunogenic protein
MRHFSVAALAAVSTLAVMQSTFAADLPRRAPAYTPPMPIAYSWTGFYIGLNAGGHWGRDEVTTAASAINFTAVGAANFNAGAAGTNDPSGFIGGLQIGYNWQFTNFVLGFEGDVNGLTGKTTRTFIYPGPAPAAGDAFITSAESSFLATVRGRLGWAIDRTLLYATGGLAVGTVKTTDVALTNGGVTVEPTSNTTTRTGWTVGGGVEYAFLPNWTAKLEYLYVDLGNFNTTILCAANCAAGIGSTDAVVTHHWTDNIARAGINYKF